MISKVLLIAAIAFSGNISTGYTAIIRPLQGYDKGQIITSNGKNEYKNIIIREILPSNAMVKNTTINSKTPTDNLRTPATSIQAPKQSDNKNIKIQPDSRVPVVVPKKKTQYTQNNLKQKICTVFKDNCAEALLIVQRESGFNTYAVSRTNDHGLFQINAYWQRNKFKSVEDLYNPDTNIRIAYQIYKEWGYSWKAWSTCKYLPKCY